MSGLMMLRHLEYKSQADLIEDAVLQTLKVCCSEYMVPSYISWQVELFSHITPITTFKMSLTTLN